MIRVLGTVLAVMFAGFVLAASSGVIVPVPAEAQSCSPLDPSCETGGGGTQAPPQSGGGASASDRINQSGKCWTCYLFLDFETVGRRFAGEVFDGIAPEARSLLQNGVWLYFVLMGLFAAVGRMDGSDFVKRFFTLAVVAVLADLVLASGFSLYEDWVLNPFMSAGTKMAKFIVDTASLSDQSFTNDVLQIPQYETEEGPIFADLMARVEAQIWGFLAVTAPIVDNQGNIFGNIGAIFIVMVVDIAFLFVLGIFMAFMVEALFKLLSMGFLAPLLIVAVAFPITRSITWAALRINLGAMLTIMFAGGALGLTTAIVANYLDSLADAYNNSLAGGAVACDTSEGGIGQFLGLSDPCIAKIDVYSAEFLIFFIIAFISILLHLQSKTLASNLSGANDGVGPAAATVAAAKVGLAYAMSAGTATAGQAMFGRQGAGNMISSGALGTTVANLSTHGLAGFAADGVARTVGPQQSSPGSGPSFSTGGAGSPPPPPPTGGGGLLDTREGQQRFAQMIGEAVNGGRSSGNGRDRWGGGR